jgi:hypothetical protein
LIPTGFDEINTMTKDGVKKFTMSAFWVTLLNWTNVSWYCCLLANLAYDFQSSSLFPLRKQHII